MGSNSDEPLIHDDAEITVLVTGFGVRIPISGISSRVASHTMHLHAQQMLV
jgi:hypothetical protein